MNLVMQDSAKLRSNVTFKKKKEITALLGKEVIFFFREVGEVLQSTCSCQFNVPVVAGILGSDQR